MRVSRIVAIGFLSLFLTVPSVFSETFLRVQVVDQDGKGVEKAVVSVAPFQKKRGKKDKTDKDGVAEFKKLKDGYYRIWVRAEGFKPGLFEFLHAGGDSEEQVRVELKPGFVGGELYFESPGVLERSKQLAREGLALMDTQDFLGAEAKFLESLALHPSDPYIHNNLALLYVNLNHWEKAEQSLAAASDLLQVLDLLGGMEKADVVAQQAELEQLRREIPVRRLQQEADQALGAGDLTVAIAKLRELIEIEPDNAETYYYLANALAREGKTDEAIAAVDSALGKKPDEEKYRRFRLSIIETEKKNAGERAEAIVEEIQKLQDARDYEGVIARCQKASEELPDEFQGLLKFQVARANAGLDRPDEALEAYEEGLGLAPSDTESRKEMTGYLIELERYDEAFASLQVLSEMTSTAYDQSLLELAKELMQKGKQAQARVAFERVIAVNPDCAEAYYELGVEYYYGSQDGARAKEMLKKYLEIGKDPELLDNAKTLLKVIK